MEGAGVRLHRAIGFGDPRECDPFLLLDDFRSDRPEDYLKGFPWHPHRGIETITYVLRGDVEHGDSLGNKGAISSGDVQWMTAGSGIIHNEMPRGDDSGGMYGFQLWANLPASQKMMDPRYRGVLAAQIPEVETKARAAIKVIAGTVEGVTGPVRDVVIDPEYLDITVPKGVSYTHPTTEGHTVLAYVIGGKGIFCSQKDPYSYDAESGAYFDMERGPHITDGHLVMFEDGASVSVSAGDESVRFLLVSGRPLREPVAWYGPIVMNTREELRVAYEELENGTFIKSGKKA